MSSHFLLAVWGIIILELIQMVTTSHETYWYLVIKWNDPAAIQNGEFAWSSMAMPLLDGISEHERLKSLCCDVLMEC